MPLALEGMAASPCAMSARSLSMMPCCFMISATGLPTGSLSGSPARNMMGIRTSGFEPYQVTYRVEYATKAGEVMSMMYAVLLKSESWGAWYGASGA